MKIRYLGDKNRYRQMNTEALRESYLVSDLFAPGEVVLHYVDVDRTIIGSIVPAAGPLALSTAAELRADFFAERREVGVINIGGNGTVSVDGTDFDLANKDGLYIGRGSRSIRFFSADAANPAKYYLVSYPAHLACPTRKITRKDANVLELGSHREANKRTLYQMICPGVVESCQIVMGMTELAEGNVWNTMPPHTHERRSEVYMYFDFDDPVRVFHFMGEPAETRHLVLKSGDAVISPGWSIHAGAGTGDYAFIWCMGGENQAFTDMDLVQMSDLR